MRNICSAMMICLFLSGCVCATSGPPSDVAVKAAQASYVTYETLAPVCQQATMDLVKIKRDRPLTDGEQGRYNKLKLLGGYLEDYRRAHNIYIQTLQPLDREKLSALLNQVIDLGLSLGLNFSAVTLSPPKGGALP